MKAVGEEASIRWYGPLVPTVGVVLRTPTGRQYLVTKVVKRRVECVVLPDASKYQPEGGVRSMRWLKRKPKAVR